MRGHYPSRRLGLVVDGDPLLRRNVAGMLKNGGYEVLEAKDAITALRLLEARGDEVVALFTDSNVPGSMGDLAITQTTSERWPHIRHFLRNMDMGDSGRFIDKPDNV
jgi:CheY-like chemotaxis protein